MAEKFLTEENFFSQSELRLLPIRFEKVKDGRYIVGNAVGEIDFFSHEELKRISQLDFSYGDYLYKKSTKMLFLSNKGEDFSLQVLAARLRSRNDFITRGPALHLFVVSLRCEHSCPYCQVSRSSENAVGRDMTREIADGAISLALSSPEENIKIEFQGGEPLLNFDIIKYVVQKSLADAEKFSKKVEFVITTNLALLTDEILSFCKKNKIFISTSLDGPEDIHNSNRPRPGNNSYQLAVNGIKRVQEKLGHDYVSALMTTTERSLGRVKDIVDEYVNLGLKRIFLRPLSPYGFALKTKYIEKYNTDDFIEFWKEGLSYIIDLNKKGILFRENFSCILLQRMLTDNPVGFVDLRSPMGGGLGAIVYNYDGKIFASDESRMLAEVGDNEFFLGNIGEKSLKEILSQEKLISLVQETSTQVAPQCESCVFEPHCGADPVYHYSTQRDHVGIKSLSGFCSRQKQMITHLLGILSLDNEDSDILKGWVL